MLPSPSPSFPLHSPKLALHVQSPLMQSWLGPHLQRSRKAICQITGVNAAPLLPSLATRKRILQPCQRHGLYPPPLLPSKATRVFPQRPQLSLVVREVSLHGRHELRDGDEVRGALPYPRWHSSWA